MHLRRGQERIRPAQIPNWAVVALIALAGGPATRATAQGPPEGPVISEFLAQNGSGIQDEDGDFSDWVEILNPTSEPIHLDDWSLTDDPGSPRKWVFPARAVEPGGFLLVFASGKDRAAPSGELHTSFRLDAEGEYLALTMPDGESIAQDFAPTYPPQSEDVSYGLAFDSEPLIEPGAPVALHVPRNGALGTTWTHRDFEPGAGWTTGATGVGFGIADVRTAGELLVTLDARSLSGDLVRLWPNAGALGDFVPGSAVLLLEVIEGRKAVSFQGSTMWMRSTHEAPSAITGNEDWSVEVWAYNPELEASEAMVNWALRGGAPAATAQFNYGSSPVFGAMTHWGVFDRSYAGGSPAASQWHHIVVTYAGGPGGLERIYVDGQLNGSRPQTLQLHGPGDGQTMPVLLGAAATSTSLEGNTAHFTGALAQVRMHTGELTPEQVRNNFLADAKRFGFTIDRDEPISSDVISADVRKVMLDVNASIYARVPFAVPDAAPFHGLVLTMRYDDGFLAYVNGASVPAAWRNAPSLVDWDSAASAASDPSWASQGEAIALTGQLDSLRASGNTLAIQGLNSAAGDPDFRLLPELAGFSLLSGPPWFLAAPSPGLPNAPMAAGSPVFSHASRTFSEPFELELSVVAGTSIRYTRDGSAPGKSSAVYEGPLEITTVTTQIRARAFSSEGDAGPIVSRTFIALDADLSTFSSNLPVFVIDSGGEELQSDPLQPAYMAIFDREAGRNALDDAFALGTRIGMKQRGASTGGREKASLTLEAWDEEDEDKTIAPLGMPADPDWLLYGAYDFDRALIRNALTYELSNRVGRYAVRTRSVEVFLDRGGDGLSYGDYMGVYSFMEKITRGPNRVDIEEPSPSADNESGITGGYMLKIDRADPGDRGFTVGPASGAQTLLYVDPKESDITLAQRDWLQDYFEDLVAALRGPNALDPELGYAAYLDIPSWLDHYWINQLTKNPDAFRLSTYLFKDREKRVEMGPVWDFDRTMGCAVDLRAEAPTGWIDYVYGWWIDLFSDPNFNMEHEQWWYELRKTHFTTETLHGIIDDLASELDEAQARNFDRWPAVRPRWGSWQAEIDHLKDWLAQRLLSVDRRFIRPPRISHPGGTVPKGFEVTLSTTLPRSAVFYTLDGSDPRLRATSKDAKDFELFSPKAIEYGGPIRLTESVQIRARTVEGYDFGVPAGYAWGSQAEARFVVSAPAGAGDLAISEVHYNPREASAREIEAGFTDSDDFEFIELLNVGGETVDLNGVRFAQGIEFDFTDSSLLTLAPGEYAVVVKSQAGFDLHYARTPFAQGVRVAGEFAGNLRNSGERLLLETASGVPIADFEYQDGGDWPKRADGGGSSLEILDPAGATIEDYGNSSNWRASGELDGSPGAPGLGSVEGIVINEVLAAAEPPLVDGVEILNRTTGTVDLSGWFFNESDYAARAGGFRFVIPEGTELAPGAYAAFDADDFVSAGAQSASSDTLSAADGGELRLLAVESTAPIRFADWMPFGASLPGESLGRWPDGAGNLYPMSDVTFGAANSGPRVGPVVISEIYYNPDGAEEDGDFEFIEISNTLGEEVDLSGWRLRAGIDFDFPVGSRLEPHGVLVVLPFDPDDPGNTTQLRAFRRLHGIGLSVALVGGYGGQLANSGDTVRLDRAASAPADDPAYTPYVVEDEVAYDDRAPWPESADGDGDALTRTGLWTFGRDPAAWQAARPTPGAHAALPGPGPPTWVLY